MLNLSNRILGCTKCPNHKHMLCGPVLGDGKSKIMIVNESPSEEDSIIGQPLSDVRGIFLNKAILNHAGIKRSDLYITNIQKCSELEGKKCVPAKHIDNCIGYLFEEIELLRPKLIITLGKLSSIKLLKLKSNTKLKDIAGKTFKYKDIDVIPCYGPSYLINYGSEIKNTISIFSKIKDYMKEI